MRNLNTIRLNLLVGLALVASGGAAGCLTPPARELAWEGNLGDRALGIQGPVGIRTDNGRFRFALSAGDPTGAPITKTCATGADE